MISQHWFMQWLGAIRQQTIAGANVDPDLCRHMVSLGHNELTHRGLKKMALILQTPFFKCIFVKKILWLRFHWNLFIWVQLTMEISISPGKDLVNSRQAVNWTNADPVLGCNLAVASPGLNKILSQGTSLPSWTAIREELHPREQ